MLLPAYDVLLFPCFTITLPQLPHQLIHYLTDNEGYFDFEQVYKLTIADHTHNIVLRSLPADVAPQPRPRTTSSEDTPQPKPRIHRQNSKNSELVRALYMKGCQVCHLILV